MGSTVTNDGRLQLQRLRPRPGRVHLADGGVDHSGIYVGINNASAHLPTAMTDDAGTYSDTTCGLNRVCLGPNYTTCVDVVVPYNDAGIAAMLVY